MNTIYKKNLMEMSNEKILHIISCGLILIGFVLCENTTVKPKGVCPSPEISSYCECDNDVIKCFGIKPYNLSTIFSSISKSLTTEKKFFTEFWLKNQGITELEDNVFNGLRFKTITISDATNLTKISADAFKGTSDDIIEIDLNGKNQLGKNGQIKELFDLFSSLPHLQKLHFNTQVVDKIPENAFKNRQNNLFQLDFDFWFNETTRGSINTIGNNAFYYLNNLNHLSFGYHSINFIPKSAFDFELASNQTLMIYLHENNLNDTSFENGLFVNTKRPLYLYLRNNRLTYLDEKTFGVFLRNDKKNVINLELEQVVCDCRMFWLFRGRNDFYKRVMNLRCNNYGIDFWELTQKDFDDCKEV